MPILVLLTLFASFAAGCGGDDDDDASPSPSATSDAAGASGSTGPTGGESTGATGSTGSGTTGSSGPVGTPASTGPTGTLPGNLTDLSGLQSFRWDITIQGAGSLLSDAGFPSLDGADADQFTALGAYIAPDQGQVVVSLAGFEYKQTIKGNQQWTSIAGVTTGPVPAAAAADSLIYVSAFIDPATIADEAQVECGGSENVNGVDAIRCETTDDVNRDIVTGLAGSSAEIDEAAFVIWVAEEGDFVVKYDFNATGTSNGEAFEWSFLANITDINGVTSIDP